MPIAIGKVKVYAMEYIGVSVTLEEWITWRSNKAAHE